MIAQIIPAKRGPLRLAILDYIVPPELEALIRVNQLVTIPLRSKEEFGIVLSLIDKSAVASELKTILGLVHEQPFLDARQISFLQELALLYHTSLGFILKSNLPPLQKRKLKKLPAFELPTTAPTRVATKPYVFTYQTVAEKNDYLVKNIGDLPAGRQVSQTLILVPEVADVVRIFDALPPTAQKNTLTITSDLSVKEQFDVWVALWRQEKTIVIGTRAALFLPFTNLTTIIVDNESHESHKSWDMNPRFHAREAALLLARHHSARTHLIAHTLSAETYYFAKHDVYETVGALAPANRTSSYLIINSRDERRAGNTAHLSETVLEALDRPGSIFLFCQRRGTMSHISCRDCDNVLTCPRCTRSLTYYYKQSELLCHHCYYRQPMIETCAKCGGANIAFFGAGTDAIASQLKKIRPNERRPIIVIDQNTTRTKLPDGDVILVGTQYAWSSIPWERLTIFAFVDADTLLFIPEYRLTERIYCTIRDARFLLPSSAELVIQTNHPEHAVFTNLTNPEAFYTTELAERRAFHYPPYQYLLKIYLGGMSEAAATGEMGRVYTALTRLTEIAKTATITKPFAIFPLFQKGRFWQAMLVKLPYGSYKRDWKQIVATLPENAKVDPNPLTIFGL